LMLFRCYVDVLWCYSDVVLLFF